MMFSEDDGFSYPRPKQIQVGRGYRLGGYSKQKITFCDGDFAIDWEEATPSWSAILLGAILPIVFVCSLIAIVALCVGLRH